MDSKGVGWIPNSQVHHARACTGNMETFTIQYLLPCLFLTYPIKYISGQFNSPWGSLLIFPCTEFVSVHDSNLKLMRSKVSNRGDPARLGLLHTVQIHMFATQSPQQSVSVWAPEMAPRVAVGFRHHVDQNQYVLTTMN
jgi:hypothetical protein